MERLISLLFLLIPLSAAAQQSSLPPCPSAGQWHNCTGTYTSANGDKFVGVFKNNLAHGQGTYVYADGEKYTGEYRDGKRNGHGTYISAKGDKFLGEFKNNQANGLGTITYADGDKYVGEFRDDLINGQGIMNYADGDKYVGEFVNGKRFRGLYTRKNGDTYVGEFKDGTNSGYGSYTFRNNGDKYVGEVNNFQPHGEGIYYNMIGIKVRIGLWKDGNFAQAKDLDEISFPFGSNKVERAMEDSRLENCLSSNSMGVCQIRARAKTTYLCGIEQSFSLDCHYTDHYRIMLSLLVRNNLSHTVKDLKFECSQVGKSGTVLITSSKTIYDIWMPQDRKRVELELFKHEQTAQIHCKVARWLR